MMATRSVPSRWYDVRYGVISRSCKERVGRSWDRGLDMVDRLKLSVVLATYNRAETLRDTLHHLADQELDPTCYEVIVIDDGSPDHTRKVVEEALPVVPFKMTYLHHANRGPGYT